MRRCAALLVTLAAMAWAPWSVADPEYSQTGAAGLASEALQRHKALFTEDQWRAVCSEVAGADLSTWFNQVISTTAELDYAEMLDWYGLRFRPAPAGRRNVYTGITTRTGGANVTISNVRRDGPAWLAGFNVDDEIIAVNNLRVGAADWPSRLDRYPDGEKLRVLVARRGELKTLELPVERRAAESWALEVRPDATKAQQDNLKALLR